MQFSFVVKTALWFQASLEQMCFLGVKMHYILARVIYSKQGKAGSLHTPQTGRAESLWEGKGLWWGLWCSVLRQHTWQVTPPVMMCLRGALWGDHPGLLHKLFILVTTSSQSKQPFPLVVLGLCTVEGLFSASCVVHSKVAHSHSSNTKFYKVWKIMEFKFFHQQENIRLLCNCSLLFFFINFIWHSWRSLLLNVLSTINF